MGGGVGVGGGGLVTARACMHSFFALAWLSASWRKSAVAASSLPSSTSPLGAAIEAAVRRQSESGGAEVGQRWGRLEVAVGQRWVARWPWGGALASAVEGRGSARGPTAFTGVRTARLRGAAATRPGPRPRHPPRAKQAPRPAAPPAARARAHTGPSRARATRLPCLAIR